MIKKLLYFIISVIIGICSLERFLWPWSFAMGIFIMAATALFYTISVQRHCSQTFHKYIGWCWAIIPLCYCFIAVFYDGVDTWLWTVAWALGILGGAWLIRFYEQDEKANPHFMLRIPICLLIAGTVAFSVFGLNEARIIETEFVEYPIIEKEMYQDRSWEGYSYILYYDTSNRAIRNDYMRVNAEYFHSVEVGDTVPVCICTGLLKQEFYVAYENDNEDWYGLNKWARETAGNET